MGFEFAKVGIGNVGSYQISGIPYVTGGLTAPALGSSPLEITFPSVTQKIAIVNTNGSVDMRVGFSVNGVTGSNYFLVRSTSAARTGLVEMRVKADKIFLLSNGAALTSNVYIEAELTGIQPGFGLTDSYSGSSGIG